MKVLNELSVKDLRLNKKRSVSVLPGNRPFFVLYGVWGMELVPIAVYREKVFSWYMAGL